MLDDSLVFTTSNVYGLILFDSSVDIECSSVLYFYVLFLQQGVWVVPRVTVASAGTVVWVAFYLALRQ